MKRVNERVKRTGVMKTEGSKKKCRKPAGLLAGICVTALLAGCGSASDTGMHTTQFVKSMEDNYAMNENYVASADSWGTESYYDYEEGEAEFPANAAQPADTSRKIIRRVEMNVETKEFDSLIAGVNAKVAALGGYVEQSNIYNGSTYSGYRSARSASMTVRIPQKSLYEFVEAVSEIGNVTRKTEGSDDVTLSYVDTESRQKALKTEQERLFALLEKAESLEDILTIEKRLSEVRYQIESYTATLRTYDNLVDYSTVTLSVDEVKELTPVVEETTWERMKNGFADSVESIVDGFREFMIWFVVHIPQLIIWAVVIAAVILIVKRRMTKKGEKKPGKLKRSKNKAQEPLNVSVNTYGTGDLQEEKQEKRILLAKDGKPEDTNSGGV